MNGEALDILYVGTLPPYTGGSAIVGGDLIKGWVDRGHRVRACAPISKADADVQDRFAAAVPGLELERYVVPHYDVNNATVDADYLAWERATVRSLVNATIDRGRPDVIVAGRESFGWSVPAVARDRGVPATLITHNGQWTEEMSAPGGPATFQPWLDEVRTVARVASVAQHLADAYARFGLGPVTTIRNGVDLDSFSPRPPDAALLVELRLAASDIVVVHTSNFAALKRPGDLVAAARSAIAAEPRLRFLVVGDGEAFGETRRAVEADGLAGHFRFTGWVDRSRIPGYLGLASMAVLTSRVEGLALSYLEAMACGLPLLATDIPGARELITDGVDGLLFPVGDVPRLVELILRVARDEELRARLGAAARRLALDHSLANAVDAHLALLVDAIQDPRHPSGAVRRPQGLTA